MLLSILAAVFAVGVVLLAGYFSRRTTEDAQGEAGEGGDPAPETPRHAGAMLSALFLLAFALAVVVPWTHADSARQNTYAESQALVDAYWAASALPRPVDGQVQSGLSEYAHFVRDKEWPLMAKRRLSPEGWSRLERLRAQVVALRVTDDRARDARNEVLGLVRNLSAARYQRAADVKAKPPTGLFVLTILSGVGVIVFPILVGDRVWGRTAIPLLVMAALLGMGVYLAFNISHAFSGGLAVKPDAFTSVLQEIQRNPGGG